MKLRPLKDGCFFAPPVKHELSTVAVLASRSLLTCCFNWRPHGDSNPGYRRERAMS